MTESFEDRDEFLQIYLEESEEEAEQLVGLLLQLEADPDDREALREAFRLLHTFKGSSGMMGFERINGLVHELETRFDAYRDGRERLSSETVSVTLRCVDFFRAFFAELRRGNWDQGDPRPLIAELTLAAVRVAPNRLGERATGTAPADTQGSAEAGAADIGNEPATLGSNRRHVPDESGDQNQRADDDQRGVDLSQPDAAEPTPANSADPPIDDLKASDPALADAAAPRLAEITSSPRDPERKPVSRSRVVPKTAGAGPVRLALVCIRMSSAMELPELKARLMIARLQSLGDVRRTTPDLESLDNAPRPVTLRVVIRTTHPDETLVRAMEMEGVDAVYLGDPQEADGNGARSAEPQPFRDADLEGGASGTPAATARETGTRGAARGGSPRQRGQGAETIRVGADRLDRLMNLAGELAITNARFAQLADEMRLLFRSGAPVDFDAPRVETLLQWLDGAASTALGEADPPHGGWLDCGRRVTAQISETVDQLSRVSKSLQHAVLETRMVPVGPLLNRFRRTVRDLAMRQGKQACLQIEGETTELDRRMVDELADPLVHLIRNSLDHGIESPELRKSRGKPAEGVIRLRAFHQSNHVVIELSDDGGGIDAVRIRQRAAERGLATVAELNQMSDPEVFGFIWQPGFSTAEKVSELSGRGVGMDVVKERIVSLAGSVELRSRPGRGSTVTLRLPLTLAIVNSLIIRFRGFRMAIPVTDVCEVVGVPREEIFPVQARNMIDLRGQLAPLYRLDELFDWNDALPPASPSPAGVIQAVLVRDGQKLAAIEVDDLEGNSDIVIKSLDQHFAHIPGLAGASVMGDGGVCLVLDTASLPICKSSFRTVPDRSP